MTAPTKTSPRCPYCGRLAQFCEDPTGHEIAHAESETTWRRTAQKRMAGAVLTPDSEVT